MKSKNVVLWTALAVLIVGGLTLVTAVQAVPILSRPALQALLGGPGMLENFESFNVSAGNAAGLDCAVLNSTSICNGQGPGLVVPGVAFTWGTGGGQWDGAGWFGAPSREILSGTPAGQPLIIDFTIPVDAFGVDLRAFTDFPATATMTIFGTDDITVLGTVSVSLSTSGVPVFAGWEDISGIGRVTLTQTGQPWSPLIDNLEFGKRVSNAPFDICVQDDSNGNPLQFNSTTGDYQFTKCGSDLMLGGTGSLTKRGSIITLQHYATDRRVLARIDGSVNRGTASIQLFSLGTTLTIADRNTINNTCACP